MQMGPSGSHSRRPHSPATAPFHHFFKIILHTTLKEKRLMIPDKFVRKYGEELLDVAQIVVLNGDVWKMRLTKTQNNIWFDGDWQVFVQHYAIGYGHLLVFGYKGLSNFDVLIFDKTACEIDYPYGICPNRTDHGEKYLFCCGDQMEADDKSVEIMGSGNSCPCCSLKDRVFVECASKGKTCKRYNPSKQNFGLNKRSRHAAAEDSPNFKHLNGTRNKICVKEEHHGTADLDYVNELRRGYSNKHGISCPVGLLCGEIKSKDDNVFQPKCEEYTETVAGGFAMASQKSQGAIHAARMFKTKNPSFMFMLRSYTIKKRFAYVPKGFAKRYLSGASQNIKLQVSDGREWPVRITRQTRCAITRGWKEFCRENNLEEGDVCVLELMEIKNVVMKVSIFRAADF